LPLVTRAEIESAIIDALKRASPKPIEPDRTSDLVADLGLSSIDILEAVAELEDRFGLSVPASDLSAFKTVSDASAYLDRALEHRGA
jgi:acyl carrier protein